MKTSLEHLPKERQEELKKITDLIVRLASPEKVILFGSYATGRYVNDKYVQNNVTFEYVSDFDILVVTARGEKREEHHLQEMLETKCQQLTDIPVNIIIHGIEYVNRRIAEGQYFFSDIRKEGILLYDAKTIEFSKQKELTAAEKREIAQRDFDKNFLSGKNLLTLSIHTKKHLNSLNDAVFLLHQAVERIYNTVILVFTGYKSKTHNLGKLARMSREFSPALATVFPNNSPEEIHLFTLLKKAYVDARYNEKYVITEEELEVLINKVRTIQDIAERICKERIKLL